MHPNIMLLLYESLNEDILFLQFLHMLILNFRRIKFVKKQNKTLPLNFHRG